MAEVDITAQKKSEGSKMDASAVIDQNFALASLQSCKDMHLDVLRTAAATQASVAAGLLLVQGQIAEVRLDIAREARSSAQHIEDRLNALLCDKAPVKVAVQG